MNTISIVDNADMPLLHLILDRSCRCSLHLQPPELCQKEEGGKEGEEEECEEEDDGGDDDGDDDDLSSFSAAPSQQGTLKGSKATQTVLYIIGNIIIGNIILNLILKIILSYVFLYL